MVVFTLSKRGGKSLDWRLTSISCRAGGFVGMRVMGWGWLRCRYVLGSSLEPGPHHYSPAADDTDPLSNLSPGADHGRLPLHRMPD